VTGATQKAESIFEVEQEGDTILIVPMANLRELDYQRIEAGAKDVLDLFTNPAIKNVILDFRETDYYGSTALGFFVKLWQRVRKRTGRMAFRNVSNHEKEILQIAHLNRLWPIYSSRSEALQALRE
jgi:anti-sigma B factor antagonist